MATTNAQQAEPKGSKSVTRQGKRRKRRFAGLDSITRNAAEALSAGSVTSIERDLDRRTTGYRLFRDTQAGIYADLGGADGLTTLERRLVQHCACLTAFIESEESRLVAGLELRNPDLLLPALNTYRRIATSLGLKRRARKVEDLDGYLDQLRERKGKGENG